MKKYKKNILAVILARGGSKGIPKKNIYNLSGHPLLSYSIEAAKKSKKISKIVVSTDDSKIAQISRNYGALTPFKRSKKLSGDKVTSVDALRDCVVKAENFFKEKYDYIIELPCVCPFRDNFDIDEALSILIKNKYDSVISYVDTGEKHPTRLKRIKKNKVTNFCKDYPEPDFGSRRQDFEPCYIRNGAIYAMTRNCIINLKSRNGKKSFPHLMPQKKSINIDEFFDLKIADLLIKNGECNNKPNLIKKNKDKVYKKNKYKKNLLISTPASFLKKEINYFQKKFNITIVNDLSKKNLISKLKNQDAWICQPSPRYLINNEVLKNANNLKIISTPSTGVTHINLNHCAKKNIKVISIIESKKFNNIKASSEFTFLLSLAGLKRLKVALDRTRAGYWRNAEDSFRGHEVFGRNVAVLGYGRIGKNILRFFKNFGAKPKAYDPFVSIPKKYRAKNLKKLLQTSDLVIVCISYNKKNKNFINNNFFKYMKTGAVFINTSRGEVLSEKSLLKNLKNKKISFAAVDVVKNEQELDSKKNILIEHSKNCENLLVTPHMAGLTYESEKKAFIISIKNIINYFQNEKN